MTVAWTPPAQQRSARDGIVAVMATRPLALALAVTAVLTAARMFGTVDSDVAWQLWVAGRINAGAHLYRDIIEVNPPLWFWMAVPVDRLASLLGVRPESVLTAAIGGFAMLALAAASRLLTDLSNDRRAGLLACAALVLMAIPWVHTGQREQIVLIASLPYAALIAARRAGRPVDPMLAVVVGLGAACGFALKHYFLLVPAMLELWLVWERRRAWHWCRPEIVALVLAGMVYAAAILLFAREFLVSIVPLVRLSYGMLGAPTLAHLFGPFAAAGLAALLLAAIGARPMSRGNSRFGSAMLVVATAFAAIYFIQAKGWIYHSIPMLGAATLALAGRMIEETPSRTLLRLVGPALLVLPFVLAATEQRHSVVGEDVTEAVSGLHRGDTVGFLAVETAVSWSVTLQHGFRYPSRYMGFWMLNAVVANEHRADPDPRLVQLGRRVVAETVADFRCTPPRRIVVARPLPGEAGFDTLAFFMRDPKFVELMSHYRPGERTGLQRFDLAIPWTPPPRAVCRTGV